MAQTPPDDAELLSVETLTGLHYIPHFRGITPVHVVAIFAPAIPAIIFSFVLPIIPYQAVLLLFVGAFVLMVVFQWRRHPRYWIRVFQRGDLPPAVYDILSSSLFGVRVKASASYLSPFQKPAPHRAICLPYLDMRSRQKKGRS